MSYTTRIPYYPLVVGEAKGCMVKDIEGNEFIDFLSSAAVMNTGHNHPRIVAAIKDQIDKFIHYTPAYMYHVPHAKLGKKLVEITPGAYEKRVAFGLSGSASVDGALKVACSYTKRDVFVSFLRSYHGTTVGAISVSGISLNMRRHMAPLLTKVHFIPYPDCYRCIFDQTSTSCHLKCLQYFEELLQTIIPPEDVAAIILEPIQADAGVIIPPDGYYDRLQRICQGHGILIIADEVQTGFGRTGRWFATNHFSLSPDILVMGKAMASGLPLSALIARKEIMEAWEAPAHFFNTAGNPVSCIAALETIKVIEEEDLLDNAKSKGEMILEGFEAMKDRFECIGDIRGKGLLIGVDIVEDRQSKKRDRNKTAKICWRCWELGLIMVFFSDSVLRVAPPLVISEGEVNQALSIVEKAIHDVEEGRVSDQVLSKIKGW